MKYLFNKIFLSSLFILLGFLFSAENALAAITTFRLDPVEIGNTSASFNFEISGTTNEDINTTSGFNDEPFHLIILPAWGPKASFAESQSIAQDKINETVTSITENNIEITGLDPNTEYYGVVVQTQGREPTPLGGAGISGVYNKAEGEESAFKYSNFIKFTTGINLTTTLNGGGNTEEVLNTIRESQSKVETMQINIPQVGDISFNFNVNIGVRHPDQLGEPGSTDFDIFLLGQEPTAETDIDDADTIQEIDLTDIGFSFQEANQTVSGTFGDLTPGATYYVVVRRTHTPWYWLNEANEISNIAVVTTAIDGQGGSVDDIDRNQAGSLTKGNYLDQLECWSYTDGVNLSACFAHFFNLFVQLSSILTAKSADFLDIFIGYSISSSTYTDSGTAEFIKGGWGIVRDFSNIVFIFVLVFTALSTILGLPWFDMKRTVSKVIVVALVINFSLFFTNIIVDVGNITAKVFHNAIVVDDNREESQSDSGISQTSLTVAIAEKMQPQKLFSQKTYEEGDSIGYFIFLQIIITAINIYIAYIFLSVAFLFVGRTVGLIIAMVTAPFAFVSSLLPSSMANSMKNLSWNSWFGNLASMAFMPAIFLFFIYLIVKFLNITEEAFQFADLSGNGSTAGTLMTLILPIIVVVFLIMKAKDMAVSLSGEIGQKVNKWAGTATGLALGAATGGTALLGSTFLGAGASKVLRGAGGDRIRQRAAEGSTLARMQLRALEGGAKGSYDLRQTRFGKTVEKQTGLNLDNKNLGILSTSNTTARGYDTLREKREKDRIKFAESLKTKVSDDELKKTDTERQRKTYEEKFQKEWQKEKNQNQDAILDDFRKKYTEENKIPTSLDKREAGEIRTEINKARLEKYGQTLKDQASILDTGFVAGKEGDISAGEKLINNPLTASAGKMSKALNDTETKITEANKALGETVDKLKNLKDAIPNDHAELGSLKGTDISKMTSEDLQKIVKHAVSEKTEERLKHELKLDKAREAAKKNRNSQTESDLLEARKEEERMKEEIKDLNNLIKTKETQERNLDTHKQKKENILEKLKEKDSGK